MRSITNNFLVRILAILAICAFIAVSVVQFSKYQSQKAKLEALEAQVIAQEDRNALLRDRVSKEIDDDYIINAARTKLDLHLPEEIVFYNDIQ